MCGAIYVMADPPPPPDPDDPLAPPAVSASTACSPCSSASTAAEEAAVVRGALAAGVPAMVVREELQREVERRLLRTPRFYDEWT